MEVEAVVGVAIGRPGTIERVTRGPGSRVLGNPCTGTCGDRG